MEKKVNVFLMIPAFSVPAEADENQIAEYIKKRTGCQQAHLIQTRQTSSDKKITTEGLGFHLPDLQINMQTLIEVYENVKKLKEERKFLMEDFEQLSRRYQELKHPLEENKENKEEEKDEKENEEKTKNQKKSERKGKKESSLEKLKREELEIMVSRYEAYCEQLLRIIEINKITEL